MTIESIEQIEAEALRLSSELDNLAATLDDHAWKLATASDRGALARLRLVAKEVANGLRHPR